MRELIDYAWHRNGIAGEGFHVAIFDEDGDEYLGIILNERASKELGAVPCFVLKLDLLDQRDIRFGSNSWRGDHFAGFLRKAIREAEAQS